MQPDRRQLKAGTPSSLNNDITVPAVSDFVAMNAIGFLIRFVAGSSCTPNIDGYNKRRKLSEDWLKGNPATPGGRSKSKPTWGNI
jgi:hypothetical protein